MIFFKRRRFITIRISFFPDEPKTIFTENKGDICGDSLNIGIAQTFLKKVITEYKPPENTQRYISLDHHKDRGYGDCI